MALYSYITTEAVIVTVDAKSDDEAQFRIRRIMDDYSLTPADPETAAERRREAS